MIAESSGYEMPFETRRHLQEHFRIHLRSARRAPRRASGGCGSVRQFATDCTHSEGSQKENAAKLLTINTLTFAKSWQTNCPLPRMQCLSPSTKTTSRKTLVAAV